MKPILLCALVAQFLFARPRPARNRTRHICSSPCTVCANGTSYVVARRASVPSLAFRFAHPHFISVSQVPQPFLLYDVHVDLGRPEVNWEAILDSVLKRADVEDPVSAYVRFDLMCI